ncbi:MAG: type II secretion system F family protein, partial [Arenicellales bacterium]
VMAGVAELPMFSEPDAQEYFERRGGTVVAVRRVGGIIGWVLARAEIRLGRKIKRDDLIEFLNNLSIMLKSGIPILTALAESISVAENRALIRTVEHIQLSIEAGLNLSDAVDQHKQVFPETVRYLVRIGEETGDLDRTLKDAAGHLERLRQIKSDTSRSLIYPAFVFAATIGAAIFWIFYVMPGIRDMFRQMQLALPPLTVWLLKATTFLQHWAPAIGAAIAIIVAACVIAVRTNRKVRWVFHNILLHLPISSRIAQASGLAFIAEYFSLFSSSGIDILRSLKTLEGTVSNEVYRGKIIAIREGLERGNTLSAEFRHARVFPSFVVRMINIGEQSGTLSQQLQYIADEYRRRLRNVVDNIAEIVKPVAILLVGGFFIVIVVGLFLPVYQLIRQVGIAH